MFGDVLTSAEFCTIRAGRKKPEGGGLNFRWRHPNAGRRRSGAVCTGTGTSRLHLETRREFLITPWVWPQ